MNILFLSVGGLSVTFFTIFFLGCQRGEKRHRPRRSFVTKLTTCDEAVDSAVGRRTLIHLEQQMSDFLAEHQRRSLRSSSWTY